jgi:hypothetical protein
MKIMIRRLCALFLSLAVMFSLVACGGGSGSGGTNNKGEKIEYGSVKLIEEYEDTMTGVFDEKNIVDTIVSAVENSKFSSKSLCFIEYAKENLCADIVARRIIEMCKD